MENAQHGTTLLSSRLLGSDNCCFPVEKKSQTDTENDKRFYAFSVGFLTHFVDWNAERGQKGDNVLSSRLFRKVSCIFSSENVSN